MAIVGGHPKAGFRVRLERGPDGPPWSYSGEVVFPEGTFEARATVSEAHAIEVQLGAGAPAELAEKVRLLLKSIVQKSVADGLSAPVRRIERWRGEK